MQQLQNVAKVFLQYLMLQTNVTSNPEKRGYVAKQNLQKLWEKNVQNAIVANFWKINKCCKRQMVQKKNLWVKGQGLMAKLGISQK